MGADEAYEFTSPCDCVGSMEFVHKSCLYEWMRVGDDTTCSTFNAPYSADIGGQQHEAADKFIDALF